MEEENDIFCDTSKLNRVAEDTKNATLLHAPMTAPDTLSLVHELQVHQIELDIQNKELMQSRAEAEALLEQYIDLYDFAPVGYFTLDPLGNILRVNLAGANLLGVECPSLVNSRLGYFVSPDMLTVFNQFLESIHSSRTRETCEVNLLTESGSTICVQIQSAVPKDSGDFRIVVTDITERKRVEEVLARVAEHDHHIAKVFQQTVMPNFLPHQPAGYELAIRYQPALQESEVCGDFCDIFDLGEDNIGISFGDVVGHGLLAALHVTAAKNMIRSYAFLYDSPSKVMSLVNDALSRDIYSPNDMLTAFYVILNTRRNTLIYCNAGHVPPVLRRMDGKIEPLISGGPMFCGFSKQVYLEGCLTLQTGDVFVMVTDGITEAHIDKSTEQFEAEGIIRCLSKNADASAERISSAILENATRFAKAPLHDDATIMVVKKGGVLALTPPY